MRVIAGLTDWGLALALAVPACGKVDLTSPRDAPPYHTVRKGTAWHSPGLNDPEQFCVSCHGADLLGSTGAPSCYGCHGGKWN